MDDLDLVTNHPADVGRTPDGHDLTVLDGDRLGNGIGWIDGHDFALLQDQIRSAMDHSWVILGSTRLGRQGNDD